MEAKDWFIMLLVAVVWIAATVWIFLHATIAAFTAWCGLCTTMGGIYHWLTVHDDKVKDAE